MRPFIEYMRVTMNKAGNTKVVAVIIAAVIVLFITGGFLFYNSGLSAVDADNKDEVIVNIEPGSGAYDILDALDEAGLVKNKLCAKVYIKLSRPANLQAYAYVLNKSMDFKEILKIIENGDLKYVLTSKFTIIEGSTAKSAAKSIAESLHLNSSEILTAWSDAEYLKSLIEDYWFLTDEILNDDLICKLEGYLYPDTYFIVKADPTVDDITRQILDNTGDKLEPLKDQLEEKNIHELLTLASVVENESLFEEDRAKIAGVFVNRLNIDMPLQSDITVLYPLGVKRVDVTEEDLKVDSLYNTYMHTGLPVGPVCNPSIGAVKDTLNYDKNDYLYFFATEEGKVLYSKTYDEHLKNIEENGWY